MDMKVFFVGVGLTDYTNQLLNRLHSLPGMEIVNLVDSDGVGHVPPGAHQTTEGISFRVLRLDGIVKRKYSDRSYWSFRGLAEALAEVRPDIVVVSEKYIRAFMYDLPIVQKVKDLGVRIVLKDNPFRLEKYDAKKEEILKGLKDDEYTPFYVLYLSRFFERLHLATPSVTRALLVRMLAAFHIHTKEDTRKELLWRLEEKKQILGFADAGVSYIEEAYNLYGSYGMPPEKIFITYNSPDTDLLFEAREKIGREEPFLPPNSHRIIHVGRLVPWKRVDMLIEAVTALKSKYADIELLVVGYGPQETELKALSAKCGVEERVKFVGGVYGPLALGRYLMASSIYILAGMGGLSINDAMAFGRPVICSVGDGTEKELVIDSYSGLYFKSGDGEDLIRKIEFFFDNPEKMREMGEHATEIIREKINIHTVIDGYMRAFRFVSEKA